MLRPHLKHGDRGGVWQSPARDLTLRRVETVGPRGGRRIRWTVEGVDGDWPTLTAAADACRDRIEGLVYLIHLDRPFSHARHYLGWTGAQEGSLERRLAAHRAGAGARLLAHVNLAGIPYDIVRVWAGDRMLERRLKRWKGLAQLCPVCEPGYRIRRNTQRRDRTAERNR